MKYLKIVNLTNQFGQCDYKGLDIEQFVPGSQAYSTDRSYCLVTTNENITTLPIDVTELQEADYTTQRQSIISQQQANDPIKQLQSQNTQLQSDLAVANKSIGELTIMMSTLLTPTTPTT
ncbi:hypothetical protein [Desulfosporosinus sp. FKA]|uniref:hypothetical protein n=1 Tax=Desulfosporosinus sp. FKA TaxID=1969834 RepID=UPI000B497C45|nr:hypothetical protein [Desulfosporosinus sp. FKA]